MNWKILLIGGTLITVVFFSIVGFQLINSRKTSLTTPQTNITNVTQFENGVIPLEAQKAMEAEVKTQNQLIRGKVVSHVGDSFSIAMERMQPTGSMAVIGVVDIVIDEKLVKEFSCWPEFSNNSNGTRSNIKNAYIPFTDTTTLYMNGETKYNISQIDGYLNNNPYVFAALSVPLTTQLSVIQDTSNLGKQYLSQLAILGCNQ